MKTVVPMRLDARISIDGIDGSKSAVSKIAVLYRLREPKH
jgi:2-methylaconitate cis-trans-isomerase PrpF